MASSVVELIQTLYTMIDEALSAPLSRDKCVIERSKALDLLEDIRDQLPVEMSEARKMVNNRNEYLAAAKRDADDLRRRAELEAKKMLNQDKVMNTARKQAQQIMAQAEQQVKQLRRGANEYCEDLLRRTEEALSDALSEARRTRTNFRSAANMGATADTPSKNSKIFDVESDG